MMRREKRKGLDPQWSGGLSPREGSRLSGFTFIEIVATLLILETIVLSIMGMYAYSKNSTRLINDRLIVQNLLQWKAEEIMCHDFLKDETKNDEVIDPFTGYKLFTSEITNYIGLTRLKKIDVVCRWTNSWGIAEEEKISLLKADY